MEDYQQTFIENLKYLRKIKGVSQSHFAELCNVSTGTIGNIECGLAKPSFDLLITMSNILDISPAEFFTVKADKTNKKNIIIDNIIEEHELLLKIYENLTEHFEK